MARINNIPIRYIGEHLGANWSPHTEHFLSVQHAVEHLRDDGLACVGDSIVLWPVSVHESLGEIEGHVGDTADASHVLTVGPRYGVRVERL